MNERESNLPLIVCVLLSVLLHLGAVGLGMTFKGSGLATLPTGEEASATSQPNPAHDANAQDRSARHWPFRPESGRPSASASRSSASALEAPLHEKQAATPKPVPLAKEDEIQLGSDKGSGVTTMAWIGYDDFRKLQGMQGKTEQPAVQKSAEPVAGAPLVIDATPPAPAPSNGAGGAGRPGVPAPMGAALAAAGAAGSGGNGGSGGSGVSGVSGGSGGERPAPQVAEHAAVRPPPAAGPTPTRAAPPLPGARAEAAMPAAPLQPQTPRLAFATPPVDLTKPARPAPATTPPTKSSPSAPPPRSGDGAPTMILPQAAGDTPGGVPVASHPPSPPPAPMPASPPTPPASPTASATNAKPASSPPLKPSGATASSTPAGPTSPATQAASLGGPQLALATPMPSAPGSHTPQPPASPGNAPANDSESAGHPGKAGVPGTPAAPASGAAGSPGPPGVPGVPSNPTDSPRGDKESDPVSLTRDQRVALRPGGVYTLAGIEIKTVHPRFGAVTEASALPGNPEALVVFDKAGHVTKVTITQSSGYVDVDAPVEASLWLWQASGKKLAELHGKFSIPVTVVLTRGD